jgi:hypothetical protein
MQLVAWGPMLARRGEPTPTGPRADESVGELVNTKDI